ncbi:MAG TPA: hypothetical protein PK052_00555 [Anaerohalosphaeraceae bacterium]|nr:hypothetical protein [Phycisphaerae bacterium]HOK96163.1 hypothetical protein [Anaerohalosphaeraceae bacterium]HOL30445.1 hypothetical protein [Anaerohalosphaeraceae bacterium]HOM76758.1 hypothetical protein [Anaerohalosphaeraceae bacterium]HPC64086.1 hypothetical protein [Anaerohalosphaeraceae bacterium]
MKWSGWIFMLISWSVIIGMFVFCMVRTLRSDAKSSKDNSSPQDSKNPSC